MINTREIDYYDGDVLLRGFFACDDQYDRQLPAVLVAPDWGGRGVAFCDKARQLAALGYAAFAIDMYGDARLAYDKVEKRALMTPFKSDRIKLMARIGAAYHALLTLPEVNPDKLAALGYCFGGMCVLDLARSGVKVSGVVSFHGLLNAPDGLTHNALSSKVLILHGYDDPLVSQEQIQEFAIEMTERKVDWQMHIYGQTAHSFTDPNANDDEMGLHYNARSAGRSWQTTLEFLHELFQ